MSGRERGGGIGMGETAARANIVGVDRDKPGGDIAYLIRQLQRMPDCDRELFLEIADKLPALGMSITAEWLLGRVFGRARDDVCRAILAGGDLTVLSDSAVALTGGEGAGG